MGVTIVLAGSLHERVGSVEETAHPLSLVIKPIDVEHENRFGAGGVQTLQLQLDPDEAADLARVHASMRRWRWIHCGFFARPFLTLARILAGRDQPAMELAAGDALAAIDFPEPLPGSPPAAIRRVKSRLDDETRPPRVRDLAREAGMHPVYLARLFRRCFGTSMGQYLRRRRIHTVIDCLGEDRRPLSSVAHEAGFADHAHMCRAFQAETGMTPSAYELLLAP
jgi:AraC family transcriptional regulator